LPLEPNTRSRPSVILRLSTTDLQNQRSMLSKLIFEQALPEGQAAVVTRLGGTSWRDLREQAGRILQVHSTLARRRVGLALHPSAKSYAALAALDKLECDSFLFDSRLSLEDMLQMAGKLKLGALLADSASGGNASFGLHELESEEKWSGASSLTILTSGSTGEPKAARHSWTSLARPVRKGSASSPRWLLAYRPNLYAGLQVMLQCFANLGTLAIPDYDADPQSIVQFMCDAAVEFVSATPSYWRRLLMFADAGTLKRIPLAQITVGGEVVDQPILDRLRAHFPQARLVHIYATTELGRCFSVSDGLAGFPATYLDSETPDGVRLKVENRELLVQSPNSMRMYDPLSGQPAATRDWFATGDLVEIRDGRVFFVGRKTEMINVAGSKVYPVEVERVIRVIPGVLDVRVFGKNSSIAGELVACEIVAGAGEDPQAVKDAVVQACRIQLASYQQPRLIKFVERIDLSTAGKTLRTRTS